MKKFNFHRLNLLVLTLLIGWAMLPAVSQAQPDTVAYWRFEDGTAGNPVPHTAAADGDFGFDVNDVSGNGNWLSTWSEGGYAGFLYTNDVSSANVPGIGADNTLSVTNTGGVPGMFTDSSVSNPNGVDIESWQPSQFTFEASIKPEWGGHRTFVGRDATDVTGDAALAAVYFKLNPDDSLAFSYADVEGNWHSAVSAPGMIQGFDYGTDPDGLTGTWYNVRAVCDGSTLKVYANNQLVATDANVGDSADPSIAIGEGSGGDWHSGGWTVGRGFFDGFHTDRFYGYIDEVRFTDGVRSKDQWLFPADVIFSSPPDQDQTLYEGEEAAFEMEIVESDNPVDLQWFYSEDANVADAEDTAITGATDPNYVIPSVTFDDDGYYYCEITDTVTDKVYHTVAHNLTVRTEKLMSEPVITDITGGDVADFEMPLAEDVYYAVNYGGDSIIWQDVNFVSWDDSHPLDTWGMVETDPDVYVAADPEVNSTNMGWTGTTDNDIAAENLVSDFWYSSHSIAFNMTGLTPGETYDVYLFLALGEDFDSRQIRLALFGDFAYEDTVATVDIPGSNSVYVDNQNPVPAKVLSFSARAGDDGNIWGEILDGGDRWEEIALDDPEIPNEPNFPHDGGVLSAAMAVGEGFAIWQQPEDQLAAPGETAEFEVIASGVDLTYQWFKDGYAISGATSPVLTIDNVEVGDEATYYCEVTENFGDTPQTITSNEVILGVKRMRARWTLDSDDYSSFGDHIDVTGNGWDIWEISFDPNFVAGVNDVPETAVHMDAGSGYGDVESFNPSEFTNQLTVSFWLNWDGTNSNWQTFVCKRNTGAWNNDNSYWQVSTGYSSDDLWFESPNNNISAEDALTDNGEWQHIAATFDGTTGRLYVDGVLQAEGDFTFGGAPDAVFWLGAALSADDTYFANGAMDEVRIYNYALTDSDIADMYYNVTGDIPCYHAPPSQYDIDGNCRIDAADLAEFLKEWLDSGLYGEF